MNEVEQRIREIEERASRATPGPWYAHNPDDDMSMNVFLVATTPEEPDPWWDGEEEAKKVVAITLLQSPRVADVADGRWEENAGFIAHAREDVPWLLSLLREREEEVRALRHLLNEIECGTDDIREGLRGCGDHSCMVKKPLGMATNGGCRCVERNTFEVRVLLGRALRKAGRLEEENRRLKEALLMCKRRVQRLDELGVTRSDNWLAVIDAALRGEQP